MKKYIFVIGVPIIIILLIASLFIFIDSPSGLSSKILIDQLNRKKCVFEIDRNSVVKRNFFSGFDRRSDGERCVIDAARLLSLKYADDPTVLTALIDSLKKERNVDSGDGIIKVRSEIALALGRLNDKRALEPLNNVLNSEDPVVLSKDAAFEFGHEIKKGTSYEAVRVAIGHINGDLNLKNEYIMKIRIEDGFDENKLRY